MATVSDELVERVAKALRYCAEDPFAHVPSLAGMAMAMPDTFNGNYDALARAAIAALSTSEFVLPLAEEMLRAKSVYAVELQTAAVALRDQQDQLLELEETLLDAYLEKGE